MVDGDVDESWYDNLSSARHSRNWKASLVGQGGSESMSLEPPLLWTSLKHEDVYPSKAPAQCTENLAKIC